MLFHSLDYLVFLAAVLALYWALPRRGQNLLLLLASVIFYGYVHHWFLALLATSTVVDYGYGRLIAERPGRRRLWLALSVSTNLGMLATFKYFNFFIENIDALCRSLGLALDGPTLGLVLPVGISFYTFQTLGYTIDVYRGRVEARRDLLDYAVFVGFFPQLVAGPIERAARMLPQIEARRHFDPVQFREGLLLMVWGFFKKLVIADNVGLTADRVFNLADPGWPLLWVGVLAFGVQILADFSAYTDIARGTARLLGFELSENFDHPYLSRGPSEFWRRWHLSLSNWFRDYVYLPLGGSRVGRLRWALNIVAVFALSGLWHGASWNFVGWGLFWALLILAARPLHHALPAHWRSAAWLAPLRVALTFVLTHVGWLIFRESDGAWLVHHLTLSPLQASAEDWRFAAFLGIHLLVCAAPLMIHTAAAALLRRGARPGVRSEDRALALRSIAAFCLFVGILVLGSDRGPDFIYFQF